MLIYMGERLLVRWQEEIVRRLFVWPSGAVGEVYCWKEEKRVSDEWSRAAQPSKHEAKTQQRPEMWMWMIPHQQRPALSLSPPSLALLEHSSVTPLLALASLARRPVLLLTLASPPPPPPPPPPVDHDAHPVARNSTARTYNNCDNRPTPTNKRRECHCRNRPTACPCCYCAPRPPSNRSSPLHLHLPAIMANTQGDSPLSSVLSSLSTSRASSPLSSLGRRTPSPPPEIKLSDVVNTMYNTKARNLSHVDPNLPTPPPSQENSQSGSPAPDAADTSMLSDKDGPPPAKRRRVGPRDRTTRSLDLNHERVKSAEQPQYDDMLRTLHRCKKIVVIAGAGISVSAGSMCNCYSPL